MPKKILRSGREKPSLFGVSPYVESRFINFHNMEKKEKTPERLMPQDSQQTGDQAGCGLERIAFQLGIRPADNLPRSADAQHDELLAMVVGALCGK